LAKLPNARDRELAAAWLADAVKDDYTAILAASDVQVSPPKPAINMLGYPQTERLLIYLTLADSTFAAIMLASTGSGLDDIDMQIDTGFQQTPNKNRPPVGYQNQGTSLTRPCWCWDVNGRSGNTP